MKEQLFEMLFPLLKAKGFNGPTAHQLAVTIIDTIDTTQPVKGIRQQITEIDEHLSSCLSSLYTQALNLV